MLDGLYSAATGMIGQQGRIDAISNDLANTSTVGYKKLKFHFGDLLYQQMGDNRAMARGSEVGAGVRGQIMGRSMTQGTVERTEQPFDLALNGEGFFQVRTADGQIGLTRDGSFEPDAQGRLVNSSGQLLTPEVRIPAGMDVGSIKIDAEGVVRGADGRQVGRIQPVTVGAPDQMQSIGDNLFAPTAASGPLRAAPAGTQVVQGALEGSNVDVSQSFADLIESQRAYELSSRAVRTWDELLQTANQIRR